MRRKYKTTLHCCLLENQCPAIHLLVAAGDPEKNPQVLHSGLFDANFWVLLQIFVKADYCNISAGRWPLPCTLVTQQAPPYCKYVTRSCQTGSATLDFILFDLRPSCEFTVCCGVFAHVASSPALTRSCRWFLSGASTEASPHWVHAGGRAGGRTGRRSVRWCCPRTAKMTRRSSSSVSISVSISPSISVSLSVSLGLWGAVIKQPERWSAKLEALSWSALKWPS